MSYGGWAANGTCWGLVCDGMPVGTDPGWKLETDDHGCSVWTHPNNTFRGGTSNPDVETCGGVRNPNGGFEPDAD
jgi:hypothetical protein